VVVAGAIALALALALVGGLAGPAASDETTTTTSTTTTTIGAGETGASDGVLGASHPMTAEVTTPVAGPVTFTEVTDIPAITGYRPIAQMQITAPTATAAEPLRLTIDADVSDVDVGVPLASLAILRNGTPVGTCQTTITASPDPCIVSRTVVGDDMTVVVLTTAASTWTVARPVLERVAPAATATDDGAIAIAASEHEFAPESAQAVVLARVDDFADALAGVPLAKARSGPLLLTNGAALDDATLDEITRVLPVGRTVYLLGGEAALSNAVEQRLVSWGYAVVRYAGTNRYATAATIAEEGLDSPSVIVETTGVKFADALAAGAVAGHIGGAVLLTVDAKQSTATAAYIAAHHPTRYAVGGPSTTADPGAVGIAGRDRMETAVLAARHFFTNPPFLTMASAYSYTDSVTAAASAAHNGTPLLLLPTTLPVPVPVEIYVRELDEVRPTAAIFGSTTNVGQDVEGALVADLGA
jgi:hypothetical protein